MRLAHRSPHRRPGVILMVVLAMLELFAIVGITFATYADAARPGNVAFRADIAGLVRDTNDFAFRLGNDLGALADEEEVDLGAYPALTGRLQERAADLDGRVRLAIAETDDPRIRTDLRSLDRDLQAYSQNMCLLRDMIELILRGG